MQTACHTAAVSETLDVTPAEFLVVEDSVFGVKAALAAGMWCIAVTTPFTRRRIHAERVLDARWIVDDPGTLTIVRQMVAEQKRDFSVSCGNDKTSAHGL